VLLPGASPGAFDSRLRHGVNGCLVPEARITQPELVGVAFGFLLCLPLPLATVAGGSKI